MKVWYHVIAAVVGLAVAALIVYLVFGNASEQGAVQDGSAGSLAASANLCGSVEPDQLTAPKTRKLARANQPALFDAKGPLAAISDTKPQQQAWVDRVHAASGLCIDELHIDRSGNRNNVVTVSMSTTDDVPVGEAQAYVAEILQQAFTMPFLPIQVRVEANVGGKDRRLVVSRRAWNAYVARRRQLKLPNTVANLKLFRKDAGSSLARGDLAVTGW
jgi:hypothetical protein